MRLTAMITMSALMGATAVAKDGGERVPVYMSYRASISTISMAQAQGLASQMFARVGVRLEWHAGSPPIGQKGAIRIELVTHTPVSLHSDALAYARPYEGVHIQILWNRIQTTPSPTKLLAHVVVHEITHILEGIDRHSAEGVMKARWDEADFEAMAFKTLPFAPEDVDIIRAGLKARNAAVMATDKRPGATAAPVPIHGI
jgi:hypothetical protein